MLFTVIRNAQHMEFWQLLLILFGYVVLILVMLPVHELAHAFVANKLGDDTARWHGRLTANPFAHLDLWGTLMLFVFGFGYARPVPVNPRNFRNPKRDMALVALAGPVSNLLMAAISLLLYRVVLSITSSAGLDISFGEYRVGGIQLITDPTVGRFAYFRGDPAGTDGICHGPLRGSDPHFTVCIDRNGGVVNTAQFFVG